MSRLQVRIKRFFKEVHRFCKVFFWSFIVAPIAGWIPLPLFRGEAVFLVHPRTVEDTYRWLYFLEPLGKEKVEWILKHLWPIIGPPITREGETIGRTFFCPWTVKMMLENPSGAKKALKQSAKTARHLGVNWLAPGALAGSMTQLGLALKNNGMTITTGHSATTLVGSRILLKAYRKINLDPSQSTVAIVGGAGNIGSTLAHRLIDKVSRIILIDRDTPKTIRRRKEVAEEATLSRTEIEISSDTENYEALQKADAVFTATSTPEPFLKSEWLKPGAIVVDDSQPVSMSRVEARRHSGVVLQVLSYLPKTNAHFRFQRGVGKEVNYACLSELLSLAKNGTHRGVTGAVDSQGLNFISEELAKAGYDQLVFHSFGRQVREEEWKHAQQARKKEKLKL